MDGKIVEFAGIFFDDKDESEEVRRGAEILRKIESSFRLEPTRTALHCTYSYRPDAETVSTLNEIVGDIVEVELIGYGNDSMNSGFLIRIVDPFYADYYHHKDKEGVSVCPHITMSIAKSAAAVNTKNLKFKELNPPIKIKGRFGYWLRQKAKGEISNPSFDKFGTSFKM